MTDKSLLKPFEPMLASPRGKLIFPCMIQPKYDGIRCVVRGGVAMSRNLAPIANNAIREVLSLPVFEGYDGELIAGDPTAKDVYNATQDIVMDVNADPHGVVYYAFDDFTNPRLPYQLRYAKLQQRLSGNPWRDNVVMLTPALIVEDESELSALADPLFDMGYEGAMVRDLHAIYKHGRATENEGSLWKIKRMEDDEMIVYDVREKMHNANEAEIDARGKTKRSHAAEGKVGTGMLGALVGMSEKWPNRHIVVGSSNLPRIPLEEARKMFGGKTIVFKHQPAGAKDLPRFPIFKGFRDLADLS